MRLQLDLAARFDGWLDLPAPAGEQRRQPIEVERRLRLTDTDALAPTDSLYGVRAKLARGRTLDLDLAGGLSDAFGRGLDFSELRAVLVAADAANAHDLLLGGAGASAFLGPFADGDTTLRLAPAGFALLAAPAAAAWPVAVGASLLRLTNTDAAAPITCEVVLLGLAQLAAASLDLRRPMNPFLATLF